MRVEVARDMTASAAAFKSGVWPAIAQTCGGGVIEPVESVTAEGFAKSLDVMSGIDAWQVLNGTGIRGIASRVQWGDFKDGRDWGTFTVRKSRPTGSRTEWDKIQEAEGLAARGFIRCHLIVQAYFNGKKGQSLDLVAAYVVQAPQFYALCKDDFEGVRAGAGRVQGGAWYRERVYDGVIMAVFPVGALRENGCAVREIRPDTRTAA